MVAGQTGDLGVFAQPPVMGASKSATGPAITPSRITMAGSVPEEAGNRGPATMTDHAQVSPLLFCSIALHVESRTGSTRPTF